MAQSRITLAAITMAASMIAASTASFGAPIPSTINLVGDADNITIHQVREGLRADGFADLGTVVRDGGIFELSATWEGKAVDLKVNARTKTVRQIVDPQTASGDKLPSSLSLVGDADNITIQQFTAGLRGLGFSAVSDAQRSGAIFTSTATWRGEAFDLRYDASSGTVTDRNVIVSRPAEDFPSRVVLARPANKGSIQEMRRALEALGFSQIGNVEKDGRIYTLSANWQGAPVGLRVDADSSRITRR